MIVHTHTHIVGVYNEYIRSNTQKIKASHHNLQLQNRSEPEM